MQTAVAIRAGDLVEHRLIEYPRGATDTRYSKSNDYYYYCYFNYGSHLSQTTIDDRWPIRVGEQPALSVIH